MLEENGLLDSSDQDSPRAAPELKVEIYRAQRAHFTKLVETLYRVIPFYVATVGAIWAYGFSLRDVSSSNGDNYLAALVMLAAFLLAWRLLM